MVLDEHGGENVETCKGQRHWMRDCEKTEQSDGQILMESLFGEKTKDRFDLRLGFEPTTEVSRAFVLTIISSRYSRRYLGS